MKKFEEEVKRPVIGIEQSSIKPSLGKAIEFYTGKVKEYHNAFNEMNKYIDGLEAQLDYYKKDKRFEVMAEEILSLKSQLEKQQPEIPEFVAEYIESYKDRRTIYGVFDKISKKRKTYPKLYEWVFEDENSQATFALAFITGKYQVEKPQLFYLKNKLTTSYLILDTSTGYFEHWGSTEATGRYKSSFTQQEIDSMETGS
ncbi:DUF1642 domain-containing protein, partial [Lactococcus petauri]